MDARALLREAAAKREQSSLERIGDRWATYTNGALKCTACNATIKHERLWSAHADSDAHKKYASEAVPAVEDSAPGQMPVEINMERRDTSAASHHDTTQPMHDGAKRKIDTDEPEGVKRPRSEPQASEPDLDAAWQEFQQAIASPDTSLTVASASASAPAAATAAAATTTASTHIPADPASDPRYANATISAEPELAQRSQAPVPTGAAAGAATSAAALETADSEAELAARQARADKQDFLARLDEEERIQEEAIDRVQALKLRLARIKAQRS
ncbi:hypothetical protein MCUN1_000352 [Malassezia cuniculi]|uniref:Coiled-coil domain-containing protein 16 n=1 Tax=Malassezia cuniculi TaxID=948313 RepID=A0AAF0J5M3_9BASI|nr:hypothetical protein MCUN1_000352 [Malassezia cuniculi]